MTVPIGNTELDLLQMFLNKYPVFPNQSVLIPAISFNVRKQAGSRIQGLIFAGK